MKQNINIEAEGNELILRNKAGDYVIIPKKHRTEIQDMIKGNCHSCIDVLVEKLPVMADYAEDGSLYSEYLTTNPPQEKPKQHPLDPNPDGSLPSYFKGSDANPIQLDEVTVTAEAPDWVKYKRQYLKDNPFNIDEYVENRFNNPVGREAIKKIDKEGWKKELRQEGLEKRYNSTMDYVGEQLAKNKPQKEMSRSEWLNTMSDKEEELIKRNPKYQSSLWADTKRGLSSLVEQNPFQTFQNILNSSDYSDREKREMLKDYADHPVMSKLGDATKILNPLTVPSKMVQSAYKDDYSFSDALKGKKNNAGVVEDIVTDPLNLVGAGLVGKLSKADKVIDATKATSKAASKVLSKIDDIKTLPKLEQIPLDFKTDIVKTLPKLKQTPLDFRIEDVIKNISSTDRKNMEILKKGSKYFKELNNPESLKRLKEFGDEYDINLIDAYKEAEKRWNQGKNFGKHSRFEVKKTDKDWYGLSTVKSDLSDEIRRRKLQQKYGENSKEVAAFDEQLAKNKSMNYISDVVPLDRYEKTIWHELSHDINKSIIDSSPKLQEDIKNIFIDKGKADLNKVKKSREYAAEDFHTQKEEILKELDNPNELQKIGEEEFEYVTRPTETWAFLSTNLRQDLKNTGIIKNYNELLTSEKLEQAIKNGNTVFSRFEPYIKDKDAFIKLFNKMTLSIAPAVLYFQLQNNKTK